MKTLTYPYGETPEAVIRERLAATVWGKNPLMVVKAGDPLGRAEYFSADDLLTVLDALKIVGSAAELAYVPMCSGEDREIRVGGSKAAADLRISILAALGIEEA